MLPFRDDWLEGMYSPTTIDTSLSAQAPCRKSDRHTYRVSNTVNTLAHRDEVGGKLRNTRPAM